MKEFDYQVKLLSAFATGSVVESIVPPLHIIVCLDWLLEYIPTNWEEDDTVYSLLLDVFSQVVEGLGLCLDAMAHKCGSDLVVHRSAHKLTKH